MILYLIRHAHAQDRDTFKGRDSERPLTEKGMAQAEKAFRRFLVFSDKPEKIFSSPALRCSETARILADVCAVPYETDARLAAGAEVKNYLEVLSAHRKMNVIALVGHEPDLSEAAAFMTGNKGLRLVIKKGSICHIEDGVLINLIQQKVLI